MNLPTTSMAISLAFAASISLLAHDRNETRTEPLKMGGNLWVNTANSSISIQGWDKEEVQVSAEIEEDRDNPVKVDYRRRDGGLEIEAMMPEHSGWHFGFHHGSSCSFTLNVPRKLVAELRTSNASVVAKDLDGKLSVRTSNASVTLEKLSGAVDVTTSNATVKARAIKASLRGRTSNASLRFEDVEGGIDFRTSNGSITASGLDGWGQGISLGTSNGSISVDLGKATGQLNAQTSSHEKVKVERQGVELIEMAGSRVRLKIPGKDQNIALTTSNGSITIR